MRISEIKLTSPGKLCICLEDGREIKSTLATVTDLRLFSGRELDGEELEELRLSSLHSLAREKALEYLSQRQMSRKELRTKLLQKGMDEDTADYCIRWLSDRQLIDEESYAAAVVRHYAAKGFGEGRVRQELQRRGIDRELWEEALEQMPEGTDKLDRFIAARLTDPDDQGQVRKISAALFRRGYSWEEIRSALRRFQGEAGDY